jgi:hypothetical protein
MRWIEGYLSVAKVEAFFGRFRAGLPDFTWCNIPKVGKVYQKWQKYTYQKWQKYTKSGKSIPKVAKVYQKWQKYTKSGKSIPKVRKVYQITKNIANGYNI